MRNTEIANRLTQIKKEVSKLGFDYLKSQEPFPLGDVSIILKPFASIDTALNNAVKKLSVDMPGSIPKTSTLKP